MSYQFDVALSFAGEDRGFVESVAAHLKTAQVKVFYDRDSEVYLWGEDLAETLDDIYRNQSQYVVFFISSHYAEKMWTRHERRSALARALAEKYEYILPARFDATSLPGLQPTIAYISLAQETPQSFAEKLIAKIRGVAPQETPFPRPIGEVRTLHGHTGRITGLRFSQDGTRALSCSADATVRLWDLETGNEIRRFTGHTGDIFAVDWSPDERYAISGSGRDVRLHVSGLLAKVKSEIMGYETRPEDYSVRLWDVHRGIQVHRFSTIMAFHVAIHPASTHFACANSRTCEIWSIGTGQRVGVITLPDGPFVRGFAELAFSADGAYLHAIARNRVFTYTFTGETVRTLELSDSERNYVLYAFAPDRIHVLSYQFLDAWARKIFSIHNLLTGAQVSVHTNPPFVPDEGFAGKAFAGNLTRVIAYDLLANFVAFDVGAKEPCFSQERGRPRGRALALSDDGTRALTGSADGQIHLWQLP